jgi:hypothetical protein
MDEPLSEINHFGGLQTTLVVLKPPKWFKGGLQTTLVVFFKFETTFGECFCFASPG